MTFFYSTSYVNSSEGWAVGSTAGAQGNVVIHSTDFGFVWTGQTAPTTEQLFGVSFTTISSGTAVGGNGTIIHTLDGGLNWVNQTSGTTQILNAVSFADTQLGIVVGDGGTILRTTTNGVITLDDDNKTVTAYQQVNLVADIVGFNATRTDSYLNNAWGIAIGPTGIIWISANHTGSTVIYDSTGAQKLAPVNIPLGALPNGASPTGVVYNSTSNFVIPGKGPSKFIYSTEDGIISAWNSSTGATTMTVADRSSAGAVYKGIAMADDGGSSFIYVTDFHNAKVDVFSDSFVLVTTKPFNDPGIPAGFAPFGVQNIGGQLYITYAKQLAPDNHDDQAGLGNGYVDIYTPAGILVKRFATQGTLNSPWGIASAPTAFGQVANAILVGNFGDGHISVYDMNGVYQGLLMKNNTDAISIEGLWAITFDNVPPADPNRLYFTAGPGGEAHGLFGYLKKI